MSWKRPKYVQKFITSKDDVPVGYIKASNIMHEWGNNVYNSCLEDARKGKIRSVKVVRSAREMRGGEVFLHADDIKFHHEEAGSSDAPKGHKTIKQLPRDEFKEELKYMGDYMFEARRRIDLQITMLDLVLKELGVDIRNKLSKRDRDTFDTVMFGV